MLRRVLAWMADRIGTGLLYVASALLRYAERQYGPPVSPPLQEEGELPPRLQVLIEELHESCNEEDGRRDWRG